ncbi:unnamed protein product, partial [Meganyctiphanes norvegica]
GLHSSLKMLLSSTTKIPWSWYFTIYFLCIVSEKCYVQASDEEIIDALKTFLGEKLTEMDSRIDSKLSHIHSRMNSVDDTLSSIKADLTLVGGTVQSIDSEMMGLGGRSSENHMATRKLTIMQEKLFTEVNNVRENMTEGLNTLRESITEELNTLSEHVESLILDDINSSIVNITEKLAKDHTTTKKCISMQEKLFTEIHNLEQHMTEELINVTSTVKSSIIEELNTNSINMTTMIKLNSKDINSSFQDTLKSPLNTLAENISTILDIMDTNRIDSENFYSCSNTSLNNLLQETTSSEPLQLDLERNISSNLDDLEGKINASHNILLESI